MKSISERRARLLAQIEVEGRRLMSAIRGTETDAAFLRELSRREKRSSK